MDQAVRNLVDLKVGDRTLWWTVEGRAEDGHGVVLVLRFTSAQGHEAVPPYLKDTRRYSWAEARGTHVSVLLALRKAADKIKEGG